MGLSRVDVFIIDFKALRLFIWIILGGALGLPGAGVVCP